MVPTGPGQETGTFCFTNCTESCNVIRVFFDVINKRFQCGLVLQQVVEPKDNLQSLPESSITKKEVSQNNANKVRKGNEAAKTDNENGDHEDDDDDYEEDDFPPVHIKLPLQLDLDDIAGVIL